MSDAQLIEAVKSQDVAAVKRLIGSTADINQQDAQGWRPLNWAAAKGSVELVRVLVEAGADIFKIGLDMRTPYGIALAAGHVEVVMHAKKRRRRGRERQAEPPGARLL